MAFLLVFTGPPTLLRRNVVTASPPHSLICCHVQVRKRLNEELYELQQQMLSASPKVRVECAPSMANGVAAGALLAADFAMPSLEHRSHIIVTFREPVAFHRRERR